jgi:hypothetical protein
VFGLVKKRQPGYIDAWLASGEVALEKHDFALAAPAFQQAAMIDANNADAHFGLARAFADSDAEKSQAGLQKTLELNPNHVAGLLWIVDNHVDAACSRCRRSIRTSRGRWLTARCWPICGMSRR